MTATAMATTVAQMIGKASLLSNSLDVVIIPDRYRIATKLYADELRHQSDDCDR
jgi:hypothetical protein